MTDIKELFDWAWDKSKLAEAADWVTVVEIGDGGSYDWTDFYSWYSPSERRYFWGSGSGCSCNSFTDDYSSVADFENGDRAALMAGIRRFAEEYEYAVRPTDLVDALTRANSFDPRTIKAVGSDD